MTIYDYMYKYIDFSFRYYDQLTAIENKLPISENQVRVYCC